MVKLTISVLSIPISGHRDTISDLKSTDTGLSCTVSGLWTVTAGFGLEEYCFLAEESRC